MDFRILGPLEVSEAGKPLRLPGSKARAVLSILLLHANEAVSMDRLIDELWGEHPPETAANTLQVHVSQLRKALPRGKEILLTRGRGYVLKVEPEALDLARFEQLSRDARSELAAGNASAAAGKLREALELWRGPPLADLSSEFAAQPEIARLEEEHLVALEDRIEADLALARHDAVVGELEEIVAAHPLRERPRRMLMLALYRSGRQAEALALYQRTRHELVEELGIEPSPALQRLEKAILMQDPSLDAPEQPAAKPAEATPEPAEPALPPRESRRTVTVVYADLAASTETGRLDPEARVRVVESAAELVSDAITRHGGSTEAVVGDALLGVFGIPNVYEDDALRAVRAAAEARESLVAFGEELERDRAIVLDARFGVSTGELVTTGALPVRGEPVSDASRLAQTAPASGVILDAATERLVLNAVRVKPVGKRASGGPVSSWLLSEVLEGAPAFTRRLDAPMVGRESELGQLRRAFEQAVRDQTAYLFTVLGPAGIGKSRLANELRSSLADEATVLFGRCLPYGKGNTFWPLAEVVAQIAGEDPRAGIVELLSDEEDGGLVAERIAGALGVADSAAGSDETFWAVRKLLESLARERSLVVVFDDIHWGEPTFLDLIEHVADLSRSSPILVVCLARPELLEERPLWGGGKLNASTILLGPLSEQETAVLMEQLAGEAAVDDRLRAQVVEAAEGNPLFVEQMLAMLTEEGGAREELRIPPTIQALLAARLDRLEPVERAVLEQASVIGKEFGSKAVAELLDAAGRDDLAGRLHALVRKDLLLPAVSVYGGDEGFRFRHHLIRDAAYESLPKQARAESHERFAGWLEKNALERAREYDEIIGYHLEQAYRYRIELGPSDDQAAALAERAVERLSSAGRRAYNRDDPPAAVNLLSRAAALVPEGSRTWAELMADLGEAEREAGDFQRADRTLARAIEAAAALGERRLEWRTRSVRLQVRKQLPEITAEEIETEAERTREALAQLGDERGLANAWWMLAWSRWLRCRAAETEKALEHAIEFARRADAWRAEAHGLNLLLGAGLFGPLPVDRAIRRCQKVLREHVDQRRFEASAYRVLAVLYAMRGDFDQARELAGRDSRILDDLGLRFQAAAATEGYGMVELLAGNPQAAEQELRRGYDTLVQMGTTATIANVSAMLAQALYAGGRYSEALKLSEASQEAAADDDLSAQILWRGPRAKVLARRGRKKKAEELGGEAVTLAAQTDFLNQHGDALMDLAEVYRLGERPRDAVQMAEQAVKLFEQKGNVVSGARGKVFVRALGRDAREARRAAG